MWSNWNGGTEIPFQQDANTNGGFCRVLTEGLPEDIRYGLAGTDYTIYGFEDGINRDLFSGSVDVYVRVTNSAPRTLTYVSDGGVYQGAQAGVLSLRRGSEIVWADFRNVGQGDSVPMGGAATNYGINAKANRHEVAPATVVLLDYKRIVANKGEDMPSLLVQSARHRGRLNVLSASGSVRPIGPTELHPTINPTVWAP